MWWNFLSSEYEEPFSTPCWLPQGWQVNKGMFRSQKALELWKWGNKQTGRSWQKYKVKQSRKGEGSHWWLESLLHGALWRLPEKHWDSSHPEVLILSAHTEVSVEWASYVCCQELAFFPLKRPPLHPWMYLKYEQCIFIHSLFLLFVILFLSSNHLSLSGGVCRKHCTL